MDKKWSMRESANYISVINEHGDAVFHEDKHCDGAMDDARIIAAAPELLESLKGMLEIYGVREQHMEREPFASSTEVECCNQARAAIAKALGEQ